MASIHRMPLDFRRFIISSLLLILIIIIVSFLFTQYDFIFVMLYIFI